VLNHQVTELGVELEMRIIAQIMGQKTLDFHYFILLLVKNSSLYEKISVREGFLDCGKPSESLQKCFQNMESVLNACRNVSIAVESSLHTCGKVSRIEESPLYAYG
jgi:hypothetical protein